MIDPKGWARVIVAEYAAGKCTRSRAVVRFAHEALGLPVPKGYQ
jgi:hypothetical protein